MNVAVVCYCLSVVGWCRLKSVDYCCSRCVVGDCVVVLIACVKCVMYIASCVLLLCVVLCC